MTDLMYVLLVLAGIALLIARQTRPQRIGGGSRRWFVVPAVLVIVGLQQGHVVDTHHTGVSVALLAAEVVVGLLMGVGWAYTSRVWTDEDGSVWSRGTKGTAGVWLAGVAARLGIAGIGALAGVAQSYGGLLITLGISFALRGLLLMHRAGVLSQVGRPSYRGPAVERTRKDRM